MYCKIPWKVFIFVRSIRNYQPPIPSTTYLAMKTLKVALVLMIVSLQVNATGYSHNMLVAQKMLKTRKVASKTQALPIQLSTHASMVEAAAGETRKSANEEVALNPDHAAASFSQYVARWVVRVVNIQGKVLAEKFISLFSSPESVEGNLPANARFVSLSENILSYLVSPLRSLR